jgi:hypothetical protein
MGRVDRLAIVLQNEGPGSSTKGLLHSLWMRGRQDEGIALMKRDARRCSLAPAPSNDRRVTGVRDVLLPLRSQLGALVRLRG